MESSNYAQDAISEAMLRELEERQAAALWGGRPAGPAAAGAPESAAPALPPGGRGCGVRLEHSGHNLIEVIKVLRAALPGLSLKDAKNLAQRAPVHVKHCASTAGAQELKAKLERAGATVTLLLQDSDNASRGGGAYF